MGHNHSVTDRDTYFVINPITRQLSNGTSKKMSLVKGDHNSERFTFELPKEVEGHDMSLCDRVEVHYINIGGKSRAATQNEDVYVVTDHEGAFRTEGDKVIADWLISSNATMYAGSLNFVVRYVCLGEVDEATGEKSVDYVWNTAIYSGITILDSINNSEAVVEEYSDVLEEWYQKLLEASDGSIDLNSKEAVKFWVGTHEQYLELDELIEGVLYLITDDRTIEELKERLEIVEAALPRLTDAETTLDDIVNRVMILEKSSYDYTTMEREIDELQDGLTTESEQRVISDTEHARRITGLEEFVDPRMDNINGLIENLIAPVSYTLSFGSLRNAPSKVYCAIEEFSFDVLIPQPAIGVTQTRIVKPEDITVNGHGSHVVKVDDKGYESIIPENGGLPINSFAYKVYIGVAWHTNDYNGGGTITIDVNPTLVEV